MARTEVSTGPSAGTYPLGVSRPPLEVMDLPSPEEVFGVPHLGKREMFRFALGPSLVALGISVGSGEWLLGPPRDRSGRFQRGSASSSSCLLSCRFSTTSRSGATWSLRARCPWWALAARLPAFSSGCRSLSSRSSSRTFWGDGQRLPVRA